LNLVEVTKWRRGREAESEQQPRDFVLLPIFLFLISTIGYFFDTCHTSMKVNGVNGASLNGAKMDSFL